MASRPNWPLRWALLAVAVLLLVYIFGWPLATLGLEPEVSPLGMRLGPPPWADQVRMRLFEAVIAAWFFVFGASLGSFLNVVVFRTPRGLSLLGSSFCPRCGHAIRWYDNIPVFGWLHLRGRCRDCKLAIAGRYPLVELIAGLMVLAVAVAELFLGGGNLPGVTQEGHSGVSWLVLRTRWDLVATFVEHAGLLCILLSWALIRWDGFRLPKRYVLLAFVLAVTFPAIAPAVQPVAWTSPRPTWLIECTWCQRIDTTVVGALTGALLGVLQAFVARLWRHPRGSTGGDTLDLAAACALTGASLGWQAAVSTFLLSASLRVVVSTVTGGLLSRHASAPWVYLASATLLQILAWKALENLAGWPSSQTTALAAVGPVLLGLYFTLVASYVECRRAAE